MRRPTMADIARRAGVTKTAVSYALNNRPGVSNATRQHIQNIAAEMGWRVHSAARALSDGRSGTFGLIVSKPAEWHGSFYLDLISGIQDELGADHGALLFAVAESRAAEIELYREWAAQSRVDGVFLVGLQIDDPRVAALEELDLATVVFGSPTGSGSLPAHWPDDDHATRIAVDHLVGLGHRRIAKVTGPPALCHTAIRTKAFHQATREAGIESVCVEADYSQESSSRATAELLASDPRPTAIIYDSDVMAVAGRNEAGRLGFGVPQDLSIIAWGDGLLCELNEPTLTALRRDVATAAREAARMLTAAVAGAEVADVQEAPTVLIPRASTGPAAGRARSKRAP